MATMRAQIILLAAVCGLLPLTMAWGNQEAEMQAALAEAQKASTTGPADIPLIDQAVLKLPSGYVYVPRPAADHLMKAMGNHTDDRLLGLIASASNENWLVVAEFEKAGYIKDDDARDWKVDELFDSLKSGTEAANEERRTRGFPELEVVGWVEKPNYDAKTHRLVWSMSARHKNAPANEPQSVNYNTYALGRDGYITLNLIADQNSIGGFKSRAAELLSALDYKSGKTYGDFNSSTDKIAEYGLAALVAGVAAKKLGLFAIAAAFLLKFAKVIILAGAAGAGGFFKYFRRKKNDTDQA
jgi:uncharacterized membrane-anchored protein